MHRRNVKPPFIYLAGSLRCEFGSQIALHTRDTMPSKRESLPSGGTTREHPGAAAPIKFRQRASGGGELLHRARRRHPGGRVSPGTRTTGLHSSRLARVRGYTAIPKYSGVVIFSGHTRPTTSRACTRARTIYTSSLLNSVNGQPGAEF